MFDLPTHPDGNFYSIPETNEMFRKVTSELDGVADDVEGLNTAVAGIIADKYKISTSILEDESDLDDITESGNYIVTSSTSAATISNKPSGVSSSFYLVVIKFSTNTLIQIYFTGSKLFCRRKTTGGYTSWYEYTGTEQQS